MIEKIFDEMEKALMINLNNMERDMFEVFTQKRMELLKTLQNETFNSMRELAETMNRDIKNVWQDLEILEKNHLIYIQTLGRSKIPRPVRKRIVFIFE